MISEPEIAGDGEDDGALGPHSGSDRDPAPVPPRGRPRLPRPRLPGPRLPGLRLPRPRPPRVGLPHGGLPPGGLPHWRLAAGAAALASVVWAGSLFLTGYWRHDAPDLHGYRLDTSPCAGSALTPLTDAIVALDSATAPAAGQPGATAARFERGSSVDRGTCSLTVSAPADRGGTVRYAADVLVDLHKKTDPRPEFEDRRRLSDAGLVPVDTIVSVPGLGDEAYLLTPGEQTQQLKVLHGGAVFVLTFTAYSDFNVSSDTMNALHSAALPAPELQQFQPALIATVRKVMAALAH